MMSKPDAQATRLQVVAGGIAAGAVATVLARWLGRRGACWRSATVERLSRESAIAQTAVGPMEYGEIGNGSPVFIVHGTPGGFDQALATGSLLLGDRFRLIAPSRPGYLRTPLSTGRSPTQQADAFAALLDALAVDQVAVIGISGGGPAAVQLAVRHANRVSRLALVEAVTAAMGVKTGNFVRGPLTWNAFDWIAVKAVNAFGQWIVPPDARDAQTIRRFKLVATTIFPLDIRREGTLNDAQAIGSLEPLPLSEIAAPTLLIHGKRDSVVATEQSVQAARQIRRSKLILVDDRDHTTTLVTPSARDDLIQFLCE